MRKVGIITRVLIFLRILKKKSELKAKPETEFDALLKREGKGFPFSELLGVNVTCGEKKFTVTAEMEESSHKRHSMGRFGMGFTSWEVKCPFCNPKHNFRIGSDLSVEKVSWSKSACR